MQDVWIENLKDGRVRYVLPYTTLSGNQKKKTRIYTKHTARNRNEARAKMLEAIDKELDKELKDSELTLSKLMDMFLEEKEKTVRYSTYRGYKSAINVISKKLDTSIPIEDITSIWIKKNTHGMNARNVNMLSTILKWAFDEFYTENVICKNCKLKVSKKKESDKKLYYEKHELEKIFTGLDTERSYSGKLTRLLLEYQLLTGARIGELLALESDDVFENYIDISKTVSDKHVGPPKTDSSYRKIGTNKRCKEIELEVKKLKIRFGVRSNLIFPSKNGEYLQLYIIRHFLKKCGAPTNKTHIFRHTHASILAEQKIPLDFIQRRLGHENDEITKRIYIHVTEKTKADDVKFFNKLEIL